MKGRVVIRRVITRAGLVPAVPGTKRQGMPCARIYRAIYAAKRAKKGSPVRPGPRVGPGRGPGDGRDGGMRARGGPSVRRPARKGSDAVRVIRWGGASPLLLVARRAVVYRSSDHARVGCGHAERSSGGVHRRPLWCRGADSPTVVLEAGLFGTTLGRRRVRPALATTNRACVSDRAGYGWSESGPHPREGRRITSERRALLSAAGVEHACAPDVREQAGMAGRSCRAP